ncbi:unnamed protein product [Cuscuta epithymum]|uniref:Uncharacterized protein n=1 Tax=Cuscuta epithymum TaxID=186058 RepID=A0AAV0F5B7_9ASTE|nr:unnamed protein product [Cuscuta epithymum]
MSLELGFNKGSEASTSASALKDSEFASPRNHDDYSFISEQKGEVHGIDHVEIDTRQATNSCFKELVKPECGYMTESSSSFDSSASWIENGDAPFDAEIGSSSTWCDVSSQSHSVLGDEFKKRKKKVASHWRAFVQSLSWRIKWVELQVMQIQCQSRKYDKELSFFNHHRDFQMENVTAEGLCAKAFPFSNKTLRHKSLRRKKRRRAEDTEDISVYMSRHNLFSYYEHKESSAEGASVNDAFGPIAIPFEKDWVNHGLVAKGEHNSSEKILCQIDVLESQVRELRSRVDKALSKTAVKFSSTENLRLPSPCKALSSSPQHPPLKGGGKIGIAPQGGSTLTHGHGVNIAQVVETTSKPLFHDPNSVEDDDLINKKRVINPVVGESEPPSVDGHTVSELFPPKLTSSTIKKKKTRRKAQRLSRLSSST